VPQRDSPEGVEAVGEEAGAGLRRENKQLREEREILKEAAAWFAKETGTIPAALRIREGESGSAPEDDVPAARGLGERALPSQGSTIFQLPGRRS